MQHSSALTRRLKVALATAATIAAALAMGPTAFAVTAPTSSATTACIKHYSGPTTTRAVADYIVRLRQNGKTQTQIDRALSDQFCWERVNSNGVSTVAPMSASGNGDVTVHAPVFYYDRNLRVWNVSMSWDWAADSWGSQFSYTLGAHNVGGADGAGVSLSAGARITSPIMEYWGKNCAYTGISTAGPSTANSYGVGFRAQDQAFYFGRNACSGSYRLSDFNMEHGQILFNVDNGGTCENIHAYGSYDHSWSTTGINSVGIAPYSVSFGCSTSSNQWAWASAGSAWAYVC